jgi:hypothetical protein
LPERAELTIGGEQPDRAIETVRRLRRVGGESGYRVDSALCGVTQGGNRVGHRLHLRRLVAGHREIGDALRHVSAYLEQHCRCQAVAIPIEDYDRNNSAIRPVHPVWCDAPRPRPLSP